MRFRLNFEVICTWFNLVENIHCPRFLENSYNMMTSSNGNICCVTSPLCGEFTGPFTKASDAELDVFFHLCLKKRLSKQSQGWWFETPSPSLWRHCNVQHIDMALFSTNYLQTHVTHASVPKWPVNLWRDLNTIQNKLGFDNTIVIGICSNLVHGVKSSWFLGLNTQILWDMAASDCLIITLRSPNGRRLPAIRTVQGLPAIKSVQEDYQHIEAETKWPPFPRRHFQTHFLEWKCSNFD